MSECRGNIYAGMSGGVSADVVVIGTSMSSWKYGESKRSCCSTCRAFSLFEYLIEEVLERADENVQENENIPERVESGHG